MAKLKLLVAQENGLPKIVQGATLVGVGNANKPMVLDENGEVPEAFKSRTTAESVDAIADTAIPANSLVHYYLRDGLNRVKAATAASPTSLANGFILTQVAAAGAVTVYRRGIVPHPLAGAGGPLVQGEYFLSETAGQATQLVPQPTEPYFPFYLGQGRILQYVGETMEQGLFFDPQTRIQL